MIEKSLKNRRILIFQQRMWAMHIGHFLAKKLQDEGCRLAAVTSKKSTHNFIVNQKEVRYDLLESSDKAKDRPDLYLAGDKFALSEICQDLGVDSLWPLIFGGSRNHVRSYGDKYYYSFKQNVSDEGIVEYVKATYKSICYVFDNFKPEIIISPNFADLYHLMTYHYAKKRNIPMMVIFDSKISGIYIHSYDYNYSSGPFNDRVIALNDRQIDTPNREQARKYINEFRTTFKAPDGFELSNPRNRPQSLIKRIKHALSPYYEIFKWYTKPQINHWEAVGITIDYRPPSIILRDHFAYKYYKKATNNFPYYPFKNIKKYAYFPLQVQPEESIDIIAPYASNQIETARQIAISLPEDMTLVVREHPVMVGLRSPSYLEKIARTPNVKLVDYRISNEKVLRGAEIVICPNGTSIAEASILKKPVIQLGNLGTTLLLPGVIKHTDMTTLTQTIKEKLKGDLDTSEYERRLENYVAAAYDVGLKQNYSAAWERGDKAGLEELWEYYKKEVTRIFSVKN